jgi:hypothetical protein
MEEKSEEFDKKFARPTKRMRFMKTNPEWGPLFEAQM